LLNHDFLLLEGIVILIDAGIAWLLLRNSAPEQQGRFSRGQRAVMWLVAINLVLVLLFPPFEDIHAISRAAQPSFEGFYFVFGNTAQKQIVATLLYIEVALILINGGLLWLLFARQRGSELTAEQKRALARALQARQRRD
jgi:cytochrome b subunit of formate dehydrogenase